MLIEINPRTQGHVCTVAVSSCYGIDFTLLQLLLSMEDTRRARILSVPYTDLKNTCISIECIITPRQGIFQGENMFDELRSRLPHLMEKVVDESIFYKDGDAVRDPSNRASWLACFSVKSEQGREDAIRIGDDIRKNLRYEIN
jgi:biotin carboxylase